MAFAYWHLAVLVALLAVIGWGLRVARRPTSAGLAVVLLLVSGFLLYTLVLEEDLESDANAQLDAVGLIGVPALLGVGFGLLAMRRTGGPRG